MGWQNRRGLRRPCISRPRTRGACTLRRRLPDYLDGDITYSPLEFTLARGHARRGEMETDIETNLFPDQLEFSAGEQLDIRNQFRKSSGRKYRAVARAVVSAEWNR